MFTSVNRKVYILSGLGADERVFKKLDLVPLEPVYLKWIPPHKNESVESYASRLLSQITEKNPVLIGLSFGGMMAIEIAKQIETKKIILLSSAKTKYEIPWYYRFIGFLKIQRIFPIRYFKKVKFMTNWLFGITTHEEKVLLKTIIEETDHRYLLWSIEKILTWKNTFVPKNVIHIHGTADRVLPIRYIKCDYEIKGGGHFMTLNMPGDISDIIKKYLL